MGKKKKKEQSRMNGLNVTNAWKHLLICIPKSHIDSFGLPESDDEIGELSFVCHIWKEFHSDDEIN